MMKRFAKIIGGSAIALAFCSAAQAQTSLEVGYSMLDYRERGFGTIHTSSPAVGRAILSYELNELLSGEIMAGVGNTYESTSDAAISFKSSNMYGFYIKPRVALSDKVQIFARAGWASVTGVSRGSDGLTESQTDHGASYGAGIQVALGKEVYASLDYMSYRDNKVTNAKGTTVSIGIKF